MDEFWALVLGAILATFGGIITNWISHIIQQRKDKRNKRVDTYVKALNFLHKMRFKSFKGYTYEDTSELFTLMGLYASDKVKIHFGKVMAKIVEFRQKTDDNNEEAQRIKNLIDGFTALLKKELNLLLSKSDKDLLKVLVEKTEGNDAN